MQDAAANIFILGADITFGYICVRTDLRRKRVKVSAALFTAAVVGPGMAAFMVPSRIPAAGAIVVVASLAVGLAAVLFGRLPARQTPS
jgi:hypothetical protein